MTEQTSPLGPGVSPEYVAALLGRLLNEVTEEGQYAADAWAPDVIRLLRQHGYVIVRDYSLPVDPT